MPRPLDVLTLGLAAPSRWNPLYRRWARRQTEAALTAGLKAFLVIHGGDVVLEKGQLDEAAARGAMIDGRGYDGGARFWLTDASPPPRPKILWGWKP